MKAHIFVFRPFRVLLMRRVNCVGRVSQLARCLWLVLHKRKIQTTHTHDTTVKGVMMTGSSVRANMRCVCVMGQGKGVVTARGEQDP